MVQRSTRSEPHRSALLLLGLACAIGCGGATKSTPATPDLARFEAEAYPVLLRDCAFPACHASRERFFQVFGPGHVRLDEKTDVLTDPATAEEISYSYDRARSMQFGLAHATDSLLLRKPLEPAAGGSGHQGKDNLGRNVYLSTSDPGYQTLLRWVTGAPADEAKAP
jgi:hypothetical protein